MINDGIFGLEEAITPVIQGNQVVVNRQLKRVNGDAAIPPGQSIEFQFYVAQFPIRISIFGFAATIETVDISATPLIAASPAPPEAPAIVSSGINKSVASLNGATLSPLPTRNASIDSGILETTPPVTAEEPQPSLNAVARMRGLDPSIFGGVLGGVFDPLPTDPGSLPDPVVPFEITLTPPNGLATQVYTNPNASQIAAIPMSEVGTGRIDPVFLDKGRGLWTINVKNINADARRMHVYVTSSHALAPLQQRAIPLSLLNNLMSSVLKKALPTIAYSDGKLIVQTPTHFLALMGADSEFSLGSAVRSLLDSLPTFTPMHLAIESRSALITRINNRRSALTVEYDNEITSLIRKGYDQTSPNVVSLTLRKAKAIKACDGSISKLNNLTNDQAVFCLVLEGMFSNAPISLNVVGDIARLDNQLPQIALVFDNNMQLSQVVSNLAIDLSPALAKVALATGALAVSLAALTGATLGLIFAPLGIALALGAGIFVYNSIDDIDVEAIIRDKIMEKKPALSHYVRSAFERITSQGASVLKCDLMPQGADDGADALKVWYYDPNTAATPRPLPNPRLPTSEIAIAAFDTVAIPGGLAKTRNADAVTIKKAAKSARGKETRIKLAREAPGPLPPGFANNPESLGLLDQHEAIVVLMMENRSFDHFFHDLAATFPNRGYNPVPDDFTNAAPPGFGAPFGVVKNTDIGIGNSLIFRRPFRSLDPDHNYQHTLFQIGGGTEATKGSGEMNGFARDFALSSNSPQVVMSYFGMDSLPTYRVLADHYAVCDRWFAALPVGTYPNRLSVFQGNVPFLYNIHLDDPSIGYLEDYTLFDLLNLQGISWKFFESDLGTIRLYDRFRLDVKHVRPFDELDKTLRIGRDTGQLPRVMFIEPQFLFGNDDHAPMNIQDGQAFVKQVIGKFIENGLMDRVLFLLTYDEHGGFFDHVAPPGTSRGPAEWFNNVKSLFPQDPVNAPTCMGVRVPAMVMSKFVSNTAKHQVLDHTSILKTILLHNRRQLATAQFLRFGERVAQVAHFGELMDLPVPRVIDYAAIKQSLGYHSPTSWFSATSSATLVDGHLARLSDEHPASLLQAIARPRAKRFTGEELMTNIRKK